jgi:hypothetical protein
VSYQAWHWRLFNVSARIFGLMALFVGLGFVAWAVFLNPGASEEVHTFSGRAVLELGVVAAFCLGVGVLCLWAKPYRPDIASQEVPMSRSWWTGEPKAK